MAAVSALDLQELETWAIGDVRELTVSPSALCLLHVENILSYTATCRIATSF